MCSSLVYQVGYEKVLKYVPISFEIWHPTKLSLFCFEEIVHFVTEFFAVPVPVVSATGKRRLSNGPRVCEQCNKAFKYPSDLKKHLQIHTGKFPSAYLI